MNARGSGRLAETFRRLRDERRGALITFLMAGDPNREMSAALLAGLPDAGADIIELGMAFSDPMADGPVIEAAGHRALAGGATLRTTLDLVAGFRRKNAATPVVLMGYVNPILSFGEKAFATAAAAAGVDGVIVVDLPPEEDRSLREPLADQGIALIRLVTPTTSGARRAVVLDGAGGFVYYVAVAGITGTRSAAAADIETAVAGIRKATDLPVAVGFGIKTPEQAAAAARVADGVVVGSALVQRVESGLDENGRATADLAGDVLGFVGALAAGVRNARGAR